MAINKIINVNDGSGREFTENTVAELKFDVKPEVGSFNAVTSDAVARAVAGASGEVPQVTESDNGKVLKAVYDAGGPAVEWGDVPNEIPEYSGSDEGKVLGVTDSDGTLGWVAQQNLSAGEGIDIDAQNAVSVNVGTGLSINSGSTADMALKAILRDGKYCSIGQLTAQAVAEIKDNASLKVTVLADYTIEPNVYSFYDVRIAIAPADDGGRLPDVSAPKNILSTTNIRSSFVAGSGTGQYTMPANTQVTVDFSNPTIGSSISWAEVEANPTDYLLAIVGFYYGELYARANSNASAQDPVQKDVATIEYTIPSDNSLQVSNPVPNYTASEDGKVLGVVDNAGTAELQWVAQQNLSAGDGIDITGGEVSAKVGAGLVIADHSTTTTATETLSAPHVYESDPVTCICPASEIADALRSGTIDFTTTMAFQNARNYGLYVNLGVVLWDSTNRTPLTRYYETNWGIIFKPEISPSGSAGNWVIPANTTFHADTSNRNSYSNTTVQHVLEHIDEYCLCLMCFDDVYHEPIGGAEGYMQAPSSAAPGTVPTATMTTTSTVTVTDALNVANPVPAYSTSEDGKVLGVVDNSGTAELQWVSAGTTYVSGSSASVSLSADDTVVTNSVDVTGITVGAGVHSAIVQWVVDSTTTLPTVTDGTNALKAAVNNPSSLTVGRTVQVSILNGTWVCAEFA